MVLRDTLSRNRPLPPLNCRTIPADVVMIACMDADELAQLAGS